MNSEKRFLLAVVLSFLILVFYPIYLKWLSPKSAVPPVSAPIAAGQKAQSVLLASVPANENAQELKGSTYKFSNKHFDAEFSETGGGIRKLVLKSWATSKTGDVVLIDRDQKPGAFLVGLPGQGIDFGNRSFSLKFLDEQNGEVHLVSEEPGKWKVSKHFKFDPEKPVIWLNVEVENLSAAQATAELELTSELDVNVKEANARFRPELFVAFQDKSISSHINKIQKQPYVGQGQIHWQALRRHYFAIIVHPDEPANLVKATVQFDHHEFMQSTLQFPSTSVAPAQILKQGFLIYAGPEYYKELKSFGFGFEGMLAHGTFGIFKLWLLRGLQWAHKVTGNYGWAIILITCALKLLFTPLTHMSFESMKKMQALQPKLKALQERHKNDQAKLSKEMMDLYKRNKVNPMSGCLPMILQIPIFIAFYQVLAQTVELKGEPFIFWIRDLSEPDRAWMLPFNLPLIGNLINILPILMLGSMLWQQRLTPQTGTSDQQKMMAFMPIMFGFIFYKLPSGLVLYWFVNNMLSIFHQLFIKGKALPHYEEA